MRIVQNASTSAAGRARKAGGAQAGGSGFTLSPQAEAAPAAQSSGPAPIEGIEALVALQAVHGRDGGRKKALARGSQMLDALDDLKLSVLEGRAGEQTLLRLRSAVAAERGDAGPDSGLAAVLDEIELRAEVEIAKRDMQRRSG